MDSEYPEDKKYLDEIGLVFLKRILLGKFNPDPYYDHISFEYGSIEDYANKEIDLFHWLWGLENILETKIPLGLYSLTIPEKDCNHFNSVGEFFNRESDVFSLFLEDSHHYDKNSPFSDRVKNLCPWLFNTSIKIKNVSFLKEKINEFLNKYISDYESGRLEGINVFSLQKHNDFFLKLFNSMKDLDQRNLLIDLEIVSNNLTDFYSSNIEAKGQMRLLEHFLLYEKQGQIKIKDIDFSDVGSKIPWVITIATTKPLTEIAEKEGISLQDFSGGQFEIARNTEGIKSKRISKMPVFNDGNPPKVSFNGKEWTLKKSSAQYYVLRIILDKEPGARMTIEEIKKYYRNNEDATKKLDKESGRFAKDLVRDINENIIKHLKIQQELLNCKDSTTIELLNI